MTSATTIAAQIQTFIRDTILLGQDAGLSVTTPLLDLGILSSIGVIRLVAHLNECYPVEIRPDEIMGLDFTSIESIASLIAHRLDAAPAGAGAMRSEAQPEGVAVFEVPACAQVFIMCTGIGDVGMAGRAFAATVREVVEDSSGFFHRAGIADRNLILLHDPSGQNYKHGVSADLPTPEAVCVWLRGWMARHPHIEDIYCLGVSAGGLMAMVAGNALQAKTVWSFAPRPCRPNVGQESLRPLAQLVQRATGKAVHELQADMSEHDRERIDAQVTPDVVQAYYRSLLDPDHLLDTDHLAAVVDTLSRGSGLTEHRVYYVQRDICDARIVHMLQRCPGVVPVPVTPSDPPAPAWAFSRWIPPMGWVCRDHYVLDSLEAGGEIHTLFPRFRAAAAMPAASAAPR